MLDLVNTKREEVLRFLCSKPSEEFNISEISELTGISKPYISEELDYLEEQGVVKIRRRSNQKIAGFNRENDEALNLKRLVNLNEFYSSGILSKVVEEYQYPEAIVLFGSFADGEDTEKSDVDLAIITDKELSLKGLEVMNRSVNIVEFTEDSILPEMLESLANGITVYGHLEVKSFEGV